MTKVTLEDIYAVVVNLQSNMNTMQNNMNTMQNNMNTMQNNMNTMQNNMNTMQNTLLSMKDDIHRLDKKIDATRDELNSKLEQEIQKVQVSTTKEVDRILDVVTNTLSPKIDSVVAFLEPQGYVAVNEKSKKYNA